MTWKRSIQLHFNSSTVCGYFSFEKQRTDLTDFCLYWNVKIAYPFINLQCDWTLCSIAQIVRFGYIIESIRRYGELVIHTYNLHTWYTSVVDPNRRRKVISTPIYQPIVLASVICHRIVDRWPSLKFTLNTIRQPIQVDLPVCTHVERGLLAAGNIARATTGCQPVKRHGKASVSTSAISSNLRYQVMWYRQPRRPMSRWPDHWTKMVLIITQTLPSTTDVHMQSCSTCILEGLGV